MVSPALHPPKADAATDPTKPSNAHNTFFINFSLPAHCRHQKKPLCGALYADFRAFLLYVHISPARMLLLQGRSNPFLRAIPDPHISPSYLGPCPQRFYSDLQGLPLLHIITFRKHNYISFSVQEALLNILPVFFLV